MWREEKAVIRLTFIRDRISICHSTTWPTVWPRWHELLFLLRQLIRYVTLNLQSGWLGSPTWGSIRSIGTLHHNNNSFLISSLYFPFPLSLLRFKNHPICWWFLGSFCLKKLNKLPLALLLKWVIDWHWVTVCVATSIDWCNPVQLSCTKLYKEECYLKSDKEVSDVTLQNVAYPHPVKNKWIVIFET